MSPQKTIKNFHLASGFCLSNKYTVIRRIGKGWEGEVYLVRENLTGIERAAKIFFPQRNQGNRNLKIYAKKLHYLRNCSLLIQYITQDEFIFKGTKITYLISELVEGVSLSRFVKMQRGKKLGLFEGLNFLYSLVRGIEEIHSLGEYHGDLHSDNILVQKFGVGYQLKAIDMFHYGRSTKAHYQDDLVFLLRVFHEVLGGKSTYQKSHPVVKELCCGLKSNLIKKKFKSAEHLRKYLERVNLLVG